MNLIAFLLKLPWFAYIALAGGVVWLGMQMAGGAEERAAQIQAAIDAGPPAAVALNSFTRPDQKFVEGTFQAQVVTSETTRLIDRTNGVKTGEDIMVVLADPAAGESTRAFHGLMILSTSEYELFADWAMERVVGFGELGPVIEFSGSVSNYDSEASHAKDALADRGNSVTSGALYISPYITQTRDEALASALNSANNTQGNMNGIAGFIALFGLGKFFIGRRMKSIRRSAAEEAMAAQEQEDAFNRQNMEGLRNL